MFGFHIYNWYCWLISVKSAFDFISFWLQNASFTLYGSILHLFALMCTPYPSLLGFVSQRGWPLQAACPGFSDQLASGWVWPVGDIGQRSREKSGYFSLPSLPWLHPFWNSNSCWTGPLWFHFPLGEYYLPLGSATPLPSSIPPAQESHSLSSIYPPFL